MTNDINRLIDMMYERIEDAKSPALKPNMSMVDRDEMLDLLATDGMLVKRPVLVGDDFVLVGFRQPEWEEKVK